MNELNDIFNNKQLLERALTHKSIFNEKHPSHHSGNLHNENFEFLGDAILGFIMAEWLMDLFPDDSEGELTKKRSSFVNEVFLSKIAEKLELINFIKLGKSDLGSLSDRILSSTVEAIIGALYLDQGMEKTKEFVKKVFSPLMKERLLLNTFDFDYKTRLQEFVQASGESPPLYEMVFQEGPAHAPLFQVQVKVKGQVLAFGKGKTKKQAEQEAAQKAMIIFKEKGNI